MENKKLKILILFLVIITLAATLIYSYILYSQNKKDVIPDQQVQGEDQYGQASKANIEARPFIAFLPHHSINFDVYYSSINDEVQIILNENNLSFDEAKTKNQTEAINYLISIGVKTDQQKIVWLQKQ